MRTSAVPLLLVFLAVASILALWRSWDPELPKGDVVASNELVPAIEASWPNVRLGSAAAPFSRVSVVDENGTLLANKGEPIASQRQAHRARASQFDVVVGGSRVGTIWLADGWDEAAIAAWQHNLRLASLAIAGIAVVCAVMIVVAQRRVTRPFKRLDAFARDVAAGDLDAPLQMDRGNPFGPFTEAFDIMRTELARARREEEKAKQSKKDLVAELGHDIRTPVASIAATAELLHLTEDEPKRRSKLRVIQEMTGQIEALVADLFEANEEEMAILRVQPQQVASTDVASWLRATDVDERLEPFELPECLVSADPLRIRQVFDNILANSRKYAGTDIAVTGGIDGDFLRLSIRDFGPGVPESELEAIVAKGVRGSNAPGSAGQGLGLYTASHLMERMSGSLSCRDARPGLAVDLEIPLAR
ncbi:MAG: HAMP domain-containing sensor histidine kinase [Actinomycetaceae bacterium]|nr:HAMP domain-containing sensor histidine kinase [Actinomycetaceae bacterium]